MSEATPGGPRPATVAPTTPVPPARVPAAPARGHAVIADTIDGTQLRTLLATRMRVRTRTRPRFGRSSRPRGLIF